MIVLVCGGRDYMNFAHAKYVLEGLHSFSPITMLIEGGARGADRLGSEWAKINEITRLTIFAEWKKYDKKAGMLRNQKMITFPWYTPAMVVAFPGGIGTENMIRIATLAGIPVTRV